MTPEEVIQLFSANVPSYGSIPIGTLSEVQKHVAVSLEMDKQTQDYYYQIRVDDLEGKIMPTQLLDELRDEGWALNPAKDAIQLFLKS